MSPDRRTTAKHPMSPATGMRMSMPAMRMPMGMRAGIRSVRWCGDTLRDD